ncbi:MAG TPA: acetate/propionate family kinase [Thermoanaerobaculia bacterium]|jgi:acetate kinase|nr:acetate/propionate family kinase [Thermoanaerobaculia bacterium]
MNILILNPGSSSLKAGFYRFPGETALHTGSGTTVSDVIHSISGPIDAVGVRVVHGGSRFENPAVVDDNVLAEIRKLSELAPLHNPLAIGVIEEVRRASPDVPIVAVFDTAFHQTLPPVAFTYAVPPELGIRRYGFHGISYSYVSKRLHALNAGSRLIVAHLGYGASVCAIRDGRSVDTSMGFTPMEGLVMGTRAGDLDPGVILYLMRGGRSEADLDDLLNHRCGLRALSGTGGDVRELEHAAADARAELALDVFAYHVSKYIAAYCAVLEGVDAVAFTAGIGEHSASMRKRICDRLAFVGVSLDAAANNAVSHDERRISSGAVGVWVIPTNEELEIARTVFGILGP